MSATPGSFITRHHHITIATGGAQQDYDFHTKVLGLKSVKKTAFYDGEAPIYHLYYGNDAGEESSLVTTFPVAHTGVKGRKGSGQISYVSLSIPPAALDFWRERLGAHGFEVTDNERFGERYLDFQHPCGVDYSLVAVADDARKPHSKGPVPAELMIRGTHSICVSTRDAEPMEEFMQLGWGGTRVAADRNLLRYQLGNGGSGTIIDFEVQPERKAGTWIVGEGTVHHMAFQVGSHAEQDQLKLHLEGMGYTDVSDVKNRGYFDSIYVRTPSGAMFEATVTHDDGFTCDEPRDKLGLEVMLAPQLKMSREEMLAQLGYLKD
ncbi:MAG: VOC family protein [Proteobacteria bacterium]|nr:VOC family protein [Pseudomonadota bacterium]